METEGSPRKLEDQYHNWIETERGKFTITINFERRVPGQPHVVAPTEKAERELLRYLGQVLIELPDSELSR
jgi:hypothetical protein